MRRLSFVILLLCALLATTGIAAAERPATAGKPDHAGKAARRNFVVHLTGTQQGSAADTEAKGIGVFHLSKDGSELRYLLVVPNVENVSAAHIHQGDATSTSTGSTLATLYPASGTSAQDDSDEDGGKLVRGVITASGNLVESIRSGNAYVDIHYSGGQLRGQFGAKGGFGRGESHGGGDETDDEAKPQKQRGQGQGGQGQGQGRGRGQGGQGDND